VKILEAVESDGYRLAEFLVANPVGAGSTFVLDRSPDFQSLLRLRGHHRTFCAWEGERLLGVATALWDERRDGDETVRVGEFVDLRVATRARGGRAARELLAAVVRALVEAEVDWLSAVIGDENRAAAGLVEGKAGLPRVIPLTRFVSVHYVALRLPQWRSRGVSVRRAIETDATVVKDAVRSLRRRLRLAPVIPFEWPDPTGRHRAWIATGVERETAGVLLLWDGFDVRRVRVVRYAGVDRVLRAFTTALAPLGLAVRLPPPGGALRMWASKALWNRDGSPEVTRALVSTALRAATAEGVHVLQINLQEEDPALDHLPPYPRSTFRSTLFGACRKDGKTDTDLTRGRTFYADLAMV